MDGDRTEIRKFHRKLYGLMGNFLWASSAHGFYVFDAEDFAQLQKPLWKVWLGENYECNIVKPVLG